MNKIILAISLVLLTSLLFAQPQTNKLNSFDAAITKLTLTDAQKTQIEQIRTRRTQQVASKTVSTAYNEETVKANMKIMAEEKKKERAEIRKVLTEEQRVELRKLLGAKKVN